jgi:hypothetical protein
MRRLPLAVLAAVGGVAALGGCVHRERAVVPAASPATAIVIGPGAEERIVAYPEGRYELYGDGTRRVPYQWVWIPTGAMPPDSPAPPRRNPTR